MKFSLKFVIGVGALFFSTNLFAQNNLECGSHLSDADKAYLLEELITEPIDNIDDDNNEQKVIRLPVQFHIVTRDDGSGGFDPNLIPSQFDKLNTTFKSISNEFFACQSTNFISSTAFYDLNYYPEAYAMEEMHNVPDVINIYIVGTLQLNGNTVQGIAEFPWSAHNLIVYQGKDLLQDPLLTHEMGHYFGLIHTDERIFGIEHVDGSNCETTGDFVCDTGADPGLSLFNVNFQCKYIGNSTDPKGMTYNPPVDNIMSFSPVFCKNKFTAGQLERFESSRVKYRSTLSCSGALSSNPESRDFTLFTLHPNPAANQIVIEFAESSFKDIQLSIANVAGQELFKKHYHQITENKIKVDISTWNNGLYLVSIGHKHGQKTVSFVK